MKRWLFLTLVFLVPVLMVGCLPAQAGNGTVPPVTAEPTAVPPSVVPPETDVPTAVPTEVPTPTAVPTEVPTPTATPFVLPSLDVWAAANGFQHIGTDKYYEKSASHGVAFWVEDIDDEYQVREVAVKIPNNATKAVREEALNTWVKNLAELFPPIVAEYVAGVTFVPDGDWTSFGMDGYCFSYSAKDMGRADTAFIVTSQLCPWLEPWWGLWTGGNAPCPLGDPDPSCP